MSDANKVIEAVRALRTAVVTDLPEGSIHKEVDACFAALREYDAARQSAPRVDAQETERLKAAEREACAQVCERASDHIGPDDDDWGNGHIDGSLACASAIRARAALSAEGGEG